MAIGSKARRDRRRECKGDRSRCRLQLRERVAACGDHRSWAERTEVLAPRLRAGVDALTASGVSVNKSCRLMQYIKLLEGIRPGPPVPDEDIGRRANALMEGGVLGDILEAVPTLALSPGWALHARKLLSGQFWAGEDGDSSRDEQLELWVAARAAKAGATVLLAEPDVVINADGLRFVVAAKRPRSGEAIRRHLEKAVEQIHRCGQRGLIALDLSQVLGLHQHALNVDDFDAGRRTLEAAMLSASANGEFSRWVTAVDEEHRVSGVVATVFTTMFHQGTGGIFAVRRIMGGPIHKRSLEGVEFFKKLVGMSSTPRQKGGPTDAWTI